MLKDFAHAGNLELQCCKSLLGRNEGYLDSRLNCLLERLGGDGQHGCGCCCCDLRPLFHNGWLLCRGGKIGEFGVVVDDDGCLPFTVPPGVAGGLWRLGVDWFGSLVFCAETGCMGLETVGHPGAVNAAGDREAGDSEHVWGRLFAHCCWSFVDGVAGRIEVCWRAQEEVFA